MEEHKTTHSRASLFMALSISILSFSSASYASAADSAPDASLSIVHMNFAANNTFIYNPKSLQWQAIGTNGKVVRTGHGSGGQSYCPDTHRGCRTPIGTFRVIGKRGADCRSSRYPVGRGGAPMPYCMYFSQYYAVHGSYEVPKRNASHGCIRVPPQEARWLYKNFMDVGTTVVVKPY